MRSRIRTASRRERRMPPVLRESHRRAGRIEQLARVVDAALARVLPERVRGAGSVPEAMRYCVLSSGKRFRPLLCLGGCEAVGSPARRALRAACAIELLHTYSLVHDDLPAMDDAAMRRGRPSCHRQFGEGNAILVGDALLTLAFELLGRDGTPNSLRIIRTLGRSCGTAGLIGGQALDLDALRGPCPPRRLGSAKPSGAEDRRWARPATAAALREVARRKTAALISASVVAGGLAGGANARQRARLERYGQDLGLAFQLIDDVHDGDGLARTLGADAAAREARRLIGRSLETLRPFGPGAETLRELAAMLSASA